MDIDRALSCIEQHGIVLAAARGPLPRMTELIAGAPISGSWWSHPRGKDIFRIFQAIAESPDILVCRLVDGKVTYVHRRLWPALARLADEFGIDALASVREQHTTSGRHVSTTVPFPAWVPDEVLALAAGMTADRARALLGDWATKRRGHDR